MNNEQFLSYLTKKMNKRLKKIKPLNKKFNGLKFHRIDDDKYVILFLDKNQKPILITTNKLTSLDKEYLNANFSQKILTHLYGFLGNINKNILNHASEISINNKPKTKHKKKHKERENKHECISVYIFK